ncbi:MULTISPECIES: Tox-REase-5 domain-containing protein [Myxococcus]|uniref:Tox-REase-5 domain-containing protein n=1 Tax=Myxococcus TaxID=32 RepID=UPI001F07A1D5|nr:MULTISPECIES: Tox-REase-5 domain-containing protein [Myxococcus]
MEDRDERPVKGSPLTPPQAARLLAALLGRDVTLGQFPARVAVGFMLREVLDKGEVSRAELVQRVSRFDHLAVLRPDGCLAWVRSGGTQQRVGSVEWRNGGFRAHGFELGRFYDGRTGVFRALDDALREVDGFPLADVHDDADYVGRTLDGAESAVVKLALSVGHFLTYPMDSIAAVKNLPAGVAALIESSPEYFERFRYMTRGEQIEAVAELATDLLLTTGTAAASTRSVTSALAGAEATVPVLALSAQGTLTIERVAVPVGRAAAVLGGGPGAAIILQRANTTTGHPAPSGGKGPGNWGPSREKGASERAQAYQEQISGHSYDDAYWVGGMGTKDGGVRFDGFKDGVLLEAKGPGYAAFFEDDLAPKYWYRNSGKAQDLIDQAERQRDIVRGMGNRIEWHVAEEHAANAIRKLLEGNGYKDITVVHTPARLLAR